MAIFFRGETSDLDCSSTAELHICNSPRWLLSLRTIGSNQTSYFSCLYLTCHFGSIKTICFSCESFIYLFWWQNKLRRVFLFIYLFLAVLGFVSVRGLSPVAASGGHSSSQCAGLSLSRPLLLRSTVSRHAGSVIVAHGPSCSAACGIFRDQGSNPWSPALAGGFLTTAPPGKPQEESFKGYRM